VDPEPRLKHLYNTRALSCRYIGARAFVERFPGTEIYLEFQITFEIQVISEKVPRENANPPLASSLNKIRLLIGARFHLCSSCRKGWL